MNTQATTSGIQVAQKSPLFAMAFAAALGILMVFVAGHVQATTLHDAAHDVRHATGFPCH